MDPIDWGSLELCPDCQRPRLTNSVCPHCLNKVNTLQCRERDPMTYKEKIAALPPCPLCGSSADPHPHFGDGSEDYVECLGHYNGDQCNRYSEGVSFAQWPIDPEATEPSRKPTNPKDGIGAAKRPLSYLPVPVLQEVGVAMMEGGLKYGAHNWRKAGVMGSIYFDAAGRHLFDWWEGEDIDGDSGVSHVTKAIAGLMVLRDSMIQGNWIDDRPTVNPNREEHRAALQGVVDNLRDKYTDPVPRNTEV